MESIDLIEAVLNGDSKSEKKLFNKYNKIISDYILSKYGNYSDLEDDVIEIISKVFINLKKFDKTKSNFKTWVITITKNHLIDKRRKGNNQYYFCDYSNIDDTINNINNHNAVENNDILNIISKYINEEDFNLISLKYYDGYTLNEIGKEFSIQINDVNNKINRIKKKLKKINV